MKYKIDAILLRTFFKKIYKLFPISIIIINRKMGIICFLVSF